MAILYVEDSDVDFEIAQRAFKQIGLKAPITRCCDGEDGLDYLHRRGRYGDPEQSPRPDLILLDLNLPGISGREVLMDVKSTLDLCTIPVIVLTTSSSREDIDFCYSHGANTYIPKPLDFDDFLQAARVVCDYWFQTARLRKAQEEGDPAAL